MNTHRGRRRLLALAIAAVAGFGASLPARAAVTGVDEVGTSFIPKHVDIAVNDRVVWTNRSNVSHTVTFDNGPDLHPSCPLLPVSCQGPGATVEHTFTAPGTYPYYCKIHGGRGGVGMAGVVVVPAAGTTATTVPASTTTSTAVRATTSTTVKTGTSSTTATTRVLATSSTVLRSTTTTSDTSSVLLPGEPPPFSDDTGSSAASRSGGSGGSDSGTVALIVGLLLAVSGGGGYLLWRLRPGRG